MSAVDRAASPSATRSSRASRLHASGLLREFNDAGVLAAADVHVARALAALAGEDDETVLLAVALAVRAPRLGHVHVDLAQIRDTAAVDAEEPVDLAALRWPDPGAWIAARGARARSWPASDGRRPRPARRPLRLRRLVAVPGPLLGRGGRASPPRCCAMARRRPRRVRPRRARRGLARLFGDEADGRQSPAAAAAVPRRLAVVAGGPGTGKTTTVARIVALLAEQAAGAGAPSPLVALAAPTGKAAARLQEAVHAEAGQARRARRGPRPAAGAARVDPAPAAGLAAGQRQPLPPRPQPAPAP